MTTLENQARQIQAQQHMQAQQIANLIYGSQQHIPNHQPVNNHRSPMSQASFGSSPHISQPHSPQQQQQPPPQPIHYNNVQRPISRDPQQQQHHQFINEQGQYISPMSNNHHHNQSAYSSYIDNDHSGSGGIGSMYPYEQPHQVITNQLNSFLQFFSRIKMCFSFFFFPY